MKLYEINDCERKSKEIVNIPFNSHCLNFKDVSESFPDFIMIGYNDKKLLDNIPYSIETLAFCVETTGKNPQIRLDAFYEEACFNGKDMESFKIVFDQAEQIELQSLMLQIICDLWYGAPIYLESKLKPSKKDIREVKRYLTEFNIDADIPKFNTVFELRQWRNEQYNNKITTA